MHSSRQPNLNQSLGFLAKNLPKPTINENLETITTIEQETQLKLAQADRMKPEVQIWRRPKKSTF